MLRKWSNFGKYWHLYNFEEDVTKIRIISPGVTTFNFTLGIEVRWENGRDPGIATTTSTTTTYYSIFFE